MIRQANLNDISGIMKIIQEAQKYFKENGIPQWQNGYPDEKHIQSDIEENGTYVLEENNLISDSDSEGKVDFVDSSNSEYKKERFLRHLGQS